MVARDGLCDLKTTKKHSNKAAEFFRKTVANRTNNFATSHNSKTLGQSETRTFEICLQRG